MGKRVIKLSYILAILLFFSMICYMGKSVFAKENTISVAGKLYEFDKKNNFEISSQKETRDISESSDYGSFTLVGNISSIDKVEGFPAYQVTNGNISFSYEVLENMKNAKDTKWHIDNCNSKKIDKSKLEDKIKSGAIVVQTSFDGKNWITDEVYTDINSADFQNIIYNSNNVQQVNGCFYQITVVYQLEKQIEDTKILFVNKHNYEYKKFAEVYQFYLINEAVKSTSADLTNKYNVGTIHKIKKDTGYSEVDSEEIDFDDAHYGWDIGKFYISGYTEKKGNEDNLVILKNYGDTVTLWFHLEQDIYKLNGNDKLSICEDKEGYDQNFETKKTNFKHGTLLIKYTNCENEKKDPVIYTDYLAACATTTADTKVELFEEGDYEVALNYKIKDDGLKNEYSDYRISFSFSVRNGNCMFFPFDVNTGSELKDGALTENGFRLDLAKSRFLNMNVKRLEIVERDGIYSEDVRSNAVASDGDGYINEGKYIITATSEYSASSTEKTIYVGNSPIVKALASSGYSLEKINELLATGYILNEDGTLTEEEKATEELKSELSADEEVDKTTEKVVGKSSEVSDAETASIENDKKDSNNYFLLIISCVGIIVVFVIIICVKKRGK